MDSKKKGLYSENIRPLFKRRKSKEINKELFHGEFVCLIVFLFLNVGNIQL